MTETKDPRLLGHTRRVIEEGLGGTRYKEHEIAPYAFIVRARMHTDVWSGVLFSWLSLKGHLQGFHGIDRTEIFASQEDDEVTAEFITVWERAEMLAEWLENGYSVPQMLEAMGVPTDMIELRLMRDYS
jgi:hypothetical protein